MAWTATLLVKFIRDFRRRGCFRADRPELQPTMQAVASYLPRLHAVKSAMINEKDREWNRPSKIMWTCVTVLIQTRYIRHKNYVEMLDSRIQFCERFNIQWARGDNAIFSNKLRLHLNWHGEWHNTVYLVHDNPHVTADAYHKTNTRKSTWYTIHGNTLSGPAFPDISRNSRINTTSTSHSMFIVSNTH